MGTWLIEHGQWDWQLFATTFALIFIAELPDKTAFASVFLATSHNPFAVFCGAASAFLVQSIVGVAAGSLFHFLPVNLIHYASAVLFMVFAVQMWRRNPPAEDAEPTAGTSRAIFWRSLVVAFSTIFVAEWGDLTQLATATLAGKYSSWLTIFLASTLALWLVTAIGVAIGHHAKKIFNPMVVQKVAAFAMACVSVYLLWRG
jgi:putative Ca2+/H+ antiporter (TMEM165/GDT1 family)